MTCYLEFGRQLPHHQPVAHLLKDNTVVLKGTQQEQKSCVEQRVKVPLILIFSVNTNHESVAYQFFSPLEFEVRGARKVTTGITGLWQPSIHSDVAVSSFNIDSSYHTEAEFRDSPWSPLESEDSGTRNLVRVYSDKSERELAMERSARGERNPNTCWYWGLLFHP